MIEVVSLVLIVASLLAWIQWWILDVVTEWASALERCSIPQVQHVLSESMMSNDSDKIDLKKVSECEIVNGESFEEENNTRHK
jgi:hypothetical protein